MSSIAFIIFALHMIADFPLQNDWMAANKTGGGLAHFAHTMTHFLVYFIVLYQLYGVNGALIASFVAGLHGMIDMRKWGEAKDGFEEYPFWVDQSLHIASIALAVIIFVY